MELSWRKISIKNKKMKKYLIYFFFIVLSSCKDKTEVHYFNYYGKDDKTISKDTIKFVIDRSTFQIQILSKGNSESIIFRERQDSDGIYRACISSYEKTHNISNPTKYFTNNLIVNEPFLNKEVRFNTSKSYIIGKDTFKVFSFSEFNSGTIDIWTYYLSDFGFICYYDKNNDSYLFCDSSQNSMIKTQSLIELKQLFLSDTSFFARHTYNNLNYYRGGVNE